MPSGSNRPIYLDPNQPVEKRVEDLLGRMTLEEKIRQMGYTDSQRFLQDGRFSRSLAADYFRGMGCGPPGGIRSRMQN